MESIFTNLEFWHWLTFAIILIILEIFSPGVFFLWLGISAASVGIIMMFQTTITWQSQFIWFAILSVLSITIWLVTRRFFPPAEPEVSHLNRRAEQYIGRTFNLVEPITNGMGKIKVDDSMWRVYGPEANSGMMVKVIGVDGTVFKVELV